MKKGTGRIILGSVLVFAQSLSMAGTTKFGGPLPSIHFAGRNLSQIVYESLSCASYYFLGILGLILIITGIVLVRKK